MLDVILILVGFAAFATALLYTAACDAL